jgi:hypothetical protein
MERCVQLFEDYCVVTQSVRAGLDVSVEVETTAEAALGTRDAVAHPHEWSLIALR